MKGLNMRKSLFTHTGLPASFLALLVMFTASFPTLAQTSEEPEVSPGIVATLGPQTALHVTNEQMSPLRITKAFYNEKTKEIELTLSNISEHQIAAWTVETVLPTPTNSKPFVVGRVVDRYREEQLWLNPGDDRIMRIPVSLDEEAPFFPKEVTVRVGEAVGPPGVAATPGGAERIFEWRQSIYRETHDLLGRVDTELATVGVSEDALAALQRLSQEGFTGISAFLVREASRWALAEPRSAVFELQKLRDTLAEEVRLIRSHIPVPLRCLTCEDVGSPIAAPQNPPLKAFGCPFFAAHSGSGSTSITEAWTFVCDGIGLPGQVLTATGVSGCPGGAHGQGDQSINIAECSIHTWSRTPINGVLDSEGFCYGIFGSPIFAVCPCHSSATPGFPKPDPCGGEPCSPVLISDSDGRFQLTSRTNGVLFDLNGDGTAEATAWTSGEVEDGFLVLDRDLNGVIDNGTELFGDGTPQPPSEERNGYLALAVWDDPLNGGNGDGLIGSADDIYSSLHVWVDSNHNGESEADELRSLEEFGVVELDLDYKRSERIDQYGNSFRYKSKARQDNGGVRQVYDVFFTSQE